MTVKVKFKQSGQFHSGMFKSLDLDKISKFQINHLRNTFELLATTGKPNAGHTICSCNT